MKHEYGRLRRKILLHILAIAGGVLLLWLLVQYVLIDGILQPSIQEAPNGGMLPDAEVIELNMQQLSELASVYARRQDVYLTAIGLLILLLAVLYYVMMRMTKYFKETSLGIDKLLLTDGAPVRLSPELDFMEAKLNGVKRELERRERETRDAVRRKDELVAYLAHDIRTPLTTVIGYLNLLTEKPDMPLNQRAKYLGMTLERARRLEALVNEFFEITRFNAQGIQLDVRTFDLTFLLRQLDDSFYPILKPQGKQIVIDAPEHLKLKGDAEKLARVFHNILKNAAAFSDAESVIRVEARADGAEVTVCVRDTGTPIPPGELEAIFDKFYRLDNARSAKTGGAGLGLAIAKEIVQAHGGRISARSAESETVFTVSLPNG